LSFRVRRSLLGVAIFAFAALVFSFVLTNGGWDFTASEPLGRTFVSMWDSLRASRFDVDPSAIGPEAFLRDGKAYSYFGPFPALLRGLLGGALDLERSDGSRISTLVAALFAVAAYLLALFRARRSLPRSAWVTFYLILLALTFVAGSPLLIVVASGAIYHEAIAWGLAWCLVSLTAAIYCLSTNVPSSGLLCLVSISAGLASLSRVSFAVGPYLVVGFLTLRLVWSGGARGISARQLLRPLACSAVPALLCLLFALYVNYERWGSPWTFMDVRYHVGFVSRPERLDAFQRYGSFDSSRVPTALDYYFTPRPTHFTASFPYLRLQPDRPLGMGPQPWAPKTAGPPRQDYDWIAPGLPLSLVSPFLLVCALLGVASLVKGRERSSAFLASLFVPQALLALTYPGLTLRYTAEFLPLLSLLSLGSLQAWRRLEERLGSARHGLRAFAFAVFLAGLAGAGSAVALEKLGSDRTSRSDRLNLQSYIDLLRAGDFYAFCARLSEPVAWTRSVAPGSRDDEVALILLPARPARLWSLQLAFPTPGRLPPGWRNLRVELFRAERVVEIRDLEVRATALPILLQLRTPTVDRVRLYLHRSLAPDPSHLELVPTWR
jgi:hypothetical protein